jgi:hypothetical protein
MASVVTLLSAANSETTGSAFEVLTGRDLTVAWFASGAGTVAPSVQGSFDGANWFSLSVSNPSVITTPLKYVRGYYAGSSGAGVVTLQALQSDED